jgi:hypothetical protein
MGLLHGVISVLILGGLKERHAVQIKVCVPTHHLFWDRGKPRKTFIDLAGRRTFQMPTLFWPGVRLLNTRALTVIRIRAVAFLKDYTGFLIF